MKFVNDFVAFLDPFSAAKEAVVEKASGAWEGAAKTVIDAYVNSTRVKWDKSVKQFSILSTTVGSIWNKEVTKSCNLVLQKEHILPPALGDRLRISNFYGMPNYYVWRSCYMAVKSVCPNYTAPYMHNCRLYCLLNRYIWSWKTLLGFEPVTFRTRCSSL